MKFVPLILIFSLVVSSCASGPSAHQVIGSQLAYPSVTFSEINQTLKRKGFMRMNVKKRIGNLSLVEFANWELVFDGENVVFADKLSNGKDAEAWMKNNTNEKQNTANSRQRVIIIE